MKKKSSVIRPKDEIQQPLLDSTVDSGLGPRTRPRLSFNIFSSLLLWPVNAIVKTSWKRQLDSVDSWELNEQDHADVLAREFSEAWEIEKQKPNPSLIKVSLGQSFGVFMCGILILLVNISWWLLTPLMVPVFLQYLEDERIDVWWGWVYTGALLVMSLINGLMERHADVIINKGALRVTGGLQLLIFEKVLKVATSETSVGTIGLMSADTQVLGNVLPPIITSLVDPLRLVSMVILLYLGIGYFCFVPLAIIILVIPVSVFLGGKCLYYYMAYQGGRNKRVQQENEIFNAIRIVKYYAWERAFKQKITEFRNTETRLYRGCAYYGVVMYGIIVGSPDIAIGLTFVLYGLYNPPNLATIFYSLTLLEQTRALFITIPGVILNLSQCLGAYERIRQFLLKPEIANRPVISATAKNPPKMEIRGGDFSWENNPSKLVLKNLNLKVERGLTMVVGLVGSGKSSIVHAYLRELPQMAGTTDIVGSIAYVPQTAWIFNASIRENVLFGRAYDRRLFKKVVEASALVNDFKEMPAADLTDIGEQGTNLSGGQKQRIAIARALYSGRDNYIFDDPLSAVDAHVGKHIFEQAFLTFLKGKTVLFITNQLHFLPFSDHCVYISNGIIEAQGKFDEVKASHSHFSDLMEGHGVFKEDDKDRDRGQHQKELERKEQERKKELERRKQFQKERLHRQSKTFSISSAYPEIQENELDAPETMLNRTLGDDEGFDEDVWDYSDRTKSGMMGSRSGKSKSLSNAVDSGFQSDRRKRKAKMELIGDEDKGEGQVSLSVYFFFMKAGGSLFIVGIFCLIVRGAATVGSLYWLSFWPQDYTSRLGTPGERQNTFYVSIYIALTMTSSIWMAVYYFCMTKWGLNAAQKLHRQLLGVTLRAPVAFFDTTPIGRIISRFSTDITLIDTLVYGAYMDTSFWCFFFLIIFTAMSLGIPYVWAGLPFFVAIFFWFQRFFQKASIQIQRLEAISRGPLYSHFSESLTGVTTVRAWGDQERFCAENRNRVHTHNCDWFALKYAYGWNGLILSFFNCLIFVIIYAAIILSRMYHPAGYNIGNLTIPVSMAGSSGRSLREAARNFTLVETRMNSVERVYQYVGMPQEAPAIIENSRPLPNWPARGAIEFEDVKMRYRKNTPLVLKGVSCSIKPCEKIGIVGRTGAGKSSMMQVLFRIVEVEDGKISIDKLDISTIGLEDLRSRLSIIPQTPTMFKGSVRSNLDPFTKCPDSELWQCLELCHLKDFIMELPEKLDEVVQEGGSNFSIGQRQLICLVRSLLQKPKILLMDEATANVDVETDENMQKIIRTHFRESTIMVIAHRLNTVMDMDRIMVLDHGQIAEFDSPKVLANNPSSILHGMILATGASSAKHLIKIANGELTGSRYIKEEEDDPGDLLIT